METVMKSLRPWNSQTNSLEIRLQFLNSEYEKEISVDLDWNDE